MSGSTATPYGFLPMGTVAVTVRVAPSMGLPRTVWGGSYDDGDLQWATMWTSAKPRAVAGHPPQQVLKVDTHWTAAAVAFLLSVFSAPRCHTPHAAPTPTDRTNPSRSTVSQPSTKWEHAA